MLLYDSPVSGNCYKVRLLAAQLGLSLERGDRRRGRHVEPVAAARAPEPWAGGAGAIADIGLFAYTHVANEGGFDLGGYPAVRAWLDRVRSQPRHIPITA